MGKYWEKENPAIRKSWKNVMKIYREQGKIQVFPRVNGSKYGIGRGATLDLEGFETTELNDLKYLINEAIQCQLNKKEQVN